MVTMDRSQEEQEEDEEDRDRHIGGEALKIVAFKKVCKEEELQTRSIPQ